MYAKIKTIFNFTALEKFAAIIQLFAIRTSSAVLGFALFFLIAKLINNDAMGIFSYVYSFLAIASIVCHFGFSNSIVKHLSPHFERKEYGVLKSYYVKLFKINGLSVSIAIVLVLFLLQFTSIFPNEYKIYIFHSLFALLPFTLLFTVTCIFRSLKCFGYDILFFSIIPNLMCIIATFFIKTADSLVLVFVVSVWVSFLGSFAFLFFKFRDIFAVKRVKIDFKPFLKDSSINWMSCIVIYVWENVDVLWLSHYTSATDIGTYALSKKIAYLPNFILIAVSSISARNYSILVSKKEYTTLSKEYMFFIQKLLWFALFIGICYLFIGEPLFKFIGIFNSINIHLVSLLLLISLVNVVVGISDDVLFTIGKAAYFQLIITVSFLLFLISAAYLIPEYKAYGCVVALMVGAFAKNISTFLKSKKELSVLCS